MHHEKEAAKQWSTRFSETCSTTPSQPESMHLSAPNLLSLPEEVISIIFSYLEASDTSGSFQRPRLAFPLAQTNTRLLRIFRTKLASITPKITNDSPLTLSKTHIFSVARLVGAYLRELHLPYSSCAILPRLPEFTPNLNTLAVQDDCWNSKIERLAELQVLPLRSLSIANPSKNTIRSLVFPLEKLCLKQVSTFCIPEVIQYLQNPPKKLHLHFANSEPQVSPHLLMTLQEMIPKMEEVAVEDPHHFRVFPTIEPFSEEAVQLLNTSQRDENSKCKKMILQGNVMELLRQAHPEAYIEISKRSSTFVYDGEKVYAKRIPLEPGYLEHDVSRLSDVLVSGLAHIEQWQGVLSGLRLSRVSAPSAPLAEALHLRMDVLRLSTMMIGHTQWRWFRGLKEVHLVNFRSFNRAYHAICFFRSITDLLNQFDGKLVWIEPAPKFELENHTSVMQAVLNLRRAVDDFEVRGGDAGAVRAMVSGEEW